MILAIDIGGTYIKHGYVSNDHAYDKGKFKTIFSFDELCKKIDSLIKPNTEKICISSGGFWDKDGECIGYETIAETRENNLVKHLEEKYNIPVTIQNDARCALLCEQKFGALKGCHNGLLFVLGSSVGTAVLLDGKLYEGAHKKSAMFFKMPELLEPYTFEHFSNTVVQAKGYSNMMDVEICASSGDANAKGILGNYAKAVAKKLLFARLVYDPEKIVIGGGIANSDKIMSDILNEYKNLLSIIDEENTIPIVKTEFGEDSNLIGASLVI